MGGFEDIKQDGSLLFKEENPRHPLSHAGLPSCRWAQLDAGPEEPKEDSEVHKMAMNIGRRPTLGDTETDITVEVHILHQYAAADFRGKNLRVLVSGFIRSARLYALRELLEDRHAHDLAYVCQNCFNLAPISKVPWDFVEKIYLLVVQ